MIFPEKHWLPLVQTQLLGLLGHHGDQETALHVPAFLGTLTFQTQSPVYLFTQEHAGGLGGQAPQM